MAASGSNPSPDADPSSLSPSPSEESSQKRYRVLVVEDNRTDVLMIREAVQGAKLSIDLDVVDDGEKALQYFENVDRDDSIPCPFLVIMDINLPKKQGDEILARMRTSRRCASALVVVVTSSDSPADRSTMAKLGANEYFCKPSDYDEFMKLGDVLKTLLSGGAEKGPKQ